MLIIGWTFIGHKVKASVQYGRWKITICFSLVFLYFNRSDTLMVHFTSNHSECFPFSVEQIFFLVSLVVDSAVLQHSAVPCNRCRNVISCDRLMKTDEHMWHCRHYIDADDHRCASYKYVRHFVRENLLKHCSINLWVLHHVIFQISLRRKSSAAKVTFEWSFAGMFQHVLTQPRCTLKSFATHSAQMRIEITCVVSMYSHVISMEWAITKWFTRVGYRNAIGECVLTLYDFWFCIAVCICHMWIASHLYGPIHADANCWASGRTSGKRRTERHVYAIVNHMWCHYSFRPISDFLPFFCVAPCVAWEIEWINFDWNLCDVATYTRLLLVLYTRWQISHVNRFTPAWILRCTCMLYKRLNSFEQMSHTCFLRFGLVATAGDLVSVL